MNMVKVKYFPINILLNENIWEFNTYQTKTYFNILFQIVYTYLINNWAIVKNWSIR